MFGAQEGAMAWTVLDHEAQGEDDLGVRMHV